MADRYRRSTRPPSRREALGPGESRANIDTTSRRNNATSKKMAPSSPREIPNSNNNKSLAPNASHNVRSSSPALASPSPRNGRVSAIVEDTQRKAKRNSEISNASTTASGFKRKSFVGRWQLGKTIGKGGCSSVRLVRHKDSGQKGAAKIISRSMAESVRAQSLANLANVPDRSLQDLVAAGKAMNPPPVGLLREIAIMKLLDHTNIVKLYDVWENHNEFYLIMEYVEGGELFHFVEEKGGGLGEYETVYIFRQLVAAMLYCHRISIYHRDLKPENILIDRETRRIKLIDFGMAALQPDGVKLTTACGSPHYAAPEVIASVPYDGAQADVWSCGVILYVMLTGMTPFNYDNQRNLHVMYAAIGSANYYMPPNLPAEAQDLIRKIFVVDPRKRIKMEEIWDHPFMHIFDEEWEYTGPLALAEAWIGPSPMVQGWSDKKEHEIDRDILRNMQTLWHDVPLDLLVRKLLTPEANQEKYFYAALIKHRDETLENYYGGNDAMSYAGSDYHHNARREESAPPMPKSQQHSQSQYSILNDEHLRSSQSFADVPSSGSSYDPYRPSRYRMTQEGGNYTKVTVHRRGESNGNGRAHMQYSLRVTHANRVEALRRGGRLPSTSTLSKNSSRRMSRSSLANTSQSRNSLSSSVWPSSPPVAMPVRAVTSHKRGVSFSHIRKNSNGSALTAQEPGQPDPYTPELQAKARFAQHPQPGQNGEGPASPSRAVVRSKKENATTPGVRITRARNSSTPSQFGKVDVRQASSELEKACDEAFFRTSVSSSEYTERQGPYDTPPSSVSNRDSGNSAKYVTASRPLPALPMETPTTFIARTLEETRNKLAARSAAEGTTYNSAKFEEVLATLEKIMPVAAEAEAEARRITSAPDAKRSDSKGPLPVINEEVRPDQTHSRYGGGEQRYRSVTAPVYKETRQSQDPRTVRMVSPSSPMVQADLRKRYQEPEQQFVEEPTQDTTFLSIPGANPRLSRGKSDDTVLTLRQTKSQGATGPEETLAKKKSSWFRRRKDPQSSSEDTLKRAITPQPPVWNELDGRQAQESRPNGIVRDKQPPHLILDSRSATAPPKSSSSSEFPRRPNEENKGFSKWLSGKMPWGERKEKSPGMAPANQSFGSASASPPSPLPPQTPSTAAEEPQARSWFARFLRLTPESRTLAFSVPRARARTELFRILREWQRHGISDLQYFPQDNTITGRVDKVNSLDLKPVTFRLELFVVLQNGKKAGLSLVRCQQVKGAASSFRKVVEVLESVCGERGFLVRDEAKARELCEILA